MVDVIDGVGNKVGGKEAVQSLPIQTENGIRLTMFVVRDDYKVGLAMLNPAVILPMLARTYYALPAIIAGIMLGAMAIQSLERHAAAARSRQVMMVTACKRFHIKADQIVREARASINNMGNTSLVRNS